MDYLWSPWRYQYIKGPARREGCVFCGMAASDNDDENLIVRRGRRNLIVLNRYPYTSGHAMVIPYEHHATLSEAPPETLEELILMTQRLEAAVRAEYRSEGVNIGMNIGQAAGAGVAGHIHMHVLPRWVADSNFMTTVGETRVLPEDLEATLTKLRRALAQEGA